MVYRGLWVCVLACVVGLWAGCGEDDTNNQIPGGAFDPSATDEARQVLVRTVEFAFFPSTIIAVPGELLTVILQNDGMDIHNIAFVLPDGIYELDSNVMPGEQAAFTFRVPFDEGDYEYNCPLGNHRGLGMVGTLVVQ